MPRAPEHERVEFRRKAIWLIASRAAISTLLLGSAILGQFRAPGTLPMDPFAALIGITFALTVLYLVLLPVIERRRWLVDVQLGIDALIVSAFIYVTGGVTSFFAPLYVLPIIAGSILRLRRGGVLVACVSAAAYAGVVGLQYLGPPGSLEIHWFEDASFILLPPARVAEYTVALNVFWFFALAVMAGYLAESLRSAGARLEQASHEIADLQAFSQHIIDSLISGLATTSPEGQILTFNRAAATITGHVVTNVLRKTIFEVLQLPADYEQSLHLSFEGTKGRRLDYQYTRSDGTVIELGLVASPLTMGNGRGGFLFTFQDVTETRRRDREMRMQQRLAALGEMAAGIAHEIRNPLASMAGSIQVLREELPLTEEQAQLMDIVLRESERLNETIRSFLAYARPQRFGVARLDLRTMVTDTAVLLRNSSEVGEAHVVDVAVPDEEVWYDGDESQFRQILWNLATNGLRAMPNGGRLLMATSYAEPGGARGARDVLLRVTDEGIGIPAEELDRIFQPFRGVFSRGTGLGLAIVHRIVSDYNGEIRVTSAPDLGTTVEIRFPASAAVVAA